MIVSKIDCEVFSNLPCLNIFMFEYLCVSLERGNGCCEHLKVQHSIVFNAIHQILMLSKFASFFVKNKGGY